MSVKKVWLGKVLAEYKGYKVRQMGGHRTVKASHGTEKSFFQPNGKFGVYAGRKKLIKDDFNTVEDALAYIKDIK